MGILTVMGTTIIVVQGLHTLAEWIECRKFDRNNRL